MVDWLNGKKPTLTKILLMFAIAIILSIGGWTFSQVRSLPENYVKKADVMKKLESIETKLDKRMCSLESEVNQLSQFLIEYFSSKGKEIHSETEKPKN